MEQHFSLFLLKQIWGDKTQNTATTAQNTKKNV